MPAPHRLVTYGMYNRYPELHIPRFIDSAIKFIIAKGMPTCGVSR